MKHLLTNSGGKDSQAVWLLVSKQSAASDYEVVFCDTGWEHVNVYKHNAYLAEWFGKEIKVLKNEKYPRGFIDLCISKKRVASLKARFCTEELKTKPMIDYILSLNDDVSIYQGVRNDESEARRNLKYKDEYFKFYFEPYGYDKKGKPKYHTYRKEEVFAYVDKYSVDVIRPIIKWTAEGTIAYSLEHKLKINPLYFSGAARVGCYPCVHCRHSEIKMIAMNDPERIDMIAELEAIIGRTFFPLVIYPMNFVIEGVKVYYASIRKVVEYVMRDENQGKLFEHIRGGV